MTKRIIEFVSDVTFKMAMCCIAINIISMLVVISIKEPTKMMVNFPMVMIILAILFNIISIIAKWKERRINAKNAEEMY